MKTDRRKLIKALTLGGGAVTVAKLPSTWSTPVVDSVTLPAHAQTTVGPVLSGGTTVTLDDDQMLRYRNFVQNPGSGNPLLNRIIGTAHAGDEFDSVDATTTTLRGYAERDLAQGSGWWLVQLLIHGEFFDTREASNDTSVPHLSPLDGLLTPAHAGINGFGSCFADLLYQTRVFIDLPDGDRYRSSWKTDVPVGDQCGDIPVIGEIDIRLEDVDDPDNATTALLAVRGGGDVVEKIRLTPGGSRLAVDCGEDACKFEPEEGEFE